jgi:hypothetical protein
VTKLLSPFAVQTIRKAQADLWEASRDIAAPQVDLVLERRGVGELPAQQVVANWNSPPRARVIGMDDSQSVDVLFYRLLEDGFDVQVGDKFTIDGLRGGITRVIRNRGKIQASARLITGTVYPS